MNEKKPKRIDVELHCKAAGSLNDDIEKELAAEDRAMEELLEEEELLDEPQD